MKLLCFFTSYSNIFLVPGGRQQEGENNFFFLFGRNQIIASRNMSLYHFQITVKIPDSKAEEASAQYAETKTRFSGWDLQPQGLGFLYQSEEIKKTVEMVEVRSAVKRWSVSSELVKGLGFTYMPGLYLWLLISPRMAHIFFGFLRKAGMSQPSRRSGRKEEDSSYGICGCSFMNMALLKTIYVLLFFITSYIS